MSDKCLLLASASPRRHELLTMIGWHFRVKPATQETPADLPPAALVRYLAMQKAQEVHAAHGGENIVVLGADTLVVCDGDVLSKPRDETQAIAMLSRLQGRLHEVYTGVALLMGSRRCAFVERSGVRFAPMTHEQIRWYVATGEPMDKAGAYGIQGIGGQFIRGVHGCYFNVVGLPIHRVTEHFRQLTGQDCPAPWRRHTVTRP